MSPANRHDGIGLGGFHKCAVVKIDEIAKAAAAGQTGGKAMGAVVKAVRDRVGSGADGGKIAALVKSALG